MFQGQNTQDKSTDNIKQFNIYATGVLRTRRKENGRNDIWRNNGLKLCKFGEKYWLTETRTSGKSQAESIQRKSQLGTS